jgi:hypothetical protein
MNRLWPTLIAVASALALSACATTTIEEARALATEATKASTAMENATIENHRQHADIRRIETLHGLTTPAGAPSAKLIEAQRLVVAEEAATDLKLRARIGLARQLAATYRQFSLLAEADPAAAFQTEFAKLGTSVNTLLAALNKGPVSAAAQTTIGTGLGELIRIDQAERLLRGSEDIRKLLEHAIGALEGDTQAVVQIEGVYQNARYTAAHYFIERGTLTPTDDYIAKILGANGLSLVPAKLDAAGAQERKEAVKRDLLFQRDLQTARNAQSYIDALGALKEVATLHQEFEAGQKMDLSRLIALTERLTDFANALAAAKKEDAERKAKTSKEK